MQGLRKTSLPLLASLLIGWSAGPARAQTPPLDESDVHVVRAGDAFTVDVEMHPPVPPRQAWAVLTDFEHMARFVPNLSASEVLERDGNHLKIKQTGAAHYAVFSLNFDSIREVQLDPFRQILAHGIGGNVKKMESATVLEPESGGTHLHYHAEVTPQTPLPPLVGPAAVRQQTAAQFNAMIEEMLRRQQGSN